jgi:hypothetical protein
MWAMRSDDGAHSTTGSTNRPSLRDVKERLARDLEDWLERAGRADLAAKIGQTPVLREEFRLSDGRRTFYSREAPRAYSLEFDSRESLVILDVSESQDIVAVHTLRSDL